MNAPEQGSQARLCFCTYADDLPVLPALTISAACAFEKKEVERAPLLYYLLHEQKEGGTWVHDCRGAQAALIVSAGNMVHVIIMQKWGVHLGSSLARMHWDTCP